MTDQEVVAKTCGIGLEIERSRFIELFGFEPETRPSLFRVVEYNPGRLGVTPFVRPTEAWERLRDEHFAEAAHRRFVFGILTGRITPIEPQS